MKSGRQRGFTLLELCVAMAVFMVIAGAALTLFRRHAPLMNSQQNQSFLNIGLRNAITQMQIDAVNAGAGFGSNLAGWRPIGLTINNTSASSSSPCDNTTTFVYGSNCFDSLYVITADLNTPVSRPSASNGTSCANLNTTTSVYLAPPTGVTATQLAAFFHTGDQVMLINGSGSPVQVNAVVLTGNGTVSGTLVRINHTATAANGSNTIANDPPQITTNFPPLGTSSTPASATTLGISFCPTTAWAYKLSVVSYTVDTSTATNPKLVRTQNGTSNVLMEQIVGFRVGAAIWNGTEGATYSYSPTSYITYSPAATMTDWTAIRALRATLIARTVPNSGASFGYTNGFDNGPYRVEAVSSVINPRNFSMNDQ